ncbi:iron-containing alcohol dehydrogenase [Anaerotignum lactatifermentans]|uniref:iron-containing alcohol dehydrogenase n=1 Tax=Anaerotignum lactatifermentans TaxID=160404 RepID=UPI002ED1D152
MVTDANIRKSGVTHHLEEILAQAGIICTVYDKTTPNPTTDLVEAAREVYLLENCQAIIGFGGGSSIDCAKAVGARIARPRKSLAKMKGILRVMRNLPLLIAIPTTAGTGSETTLAAVITDSHTRHKYPINDFPLIPAYAVLDPEVTRGLPPFVTATTGLDALTHAVEAYIGNSTTEDTRHDALTAVKLIFGNLKRAYDNGNDMEARRNMLQAAYFAGSAFTKSYVGYVHAIAHSLGGRYNTPHGLANAVLLPHVLRAYGKTAWKKLHILGMAAGVSTPHDTHQAGAEKFIRAIEGLMEQMQIPRTIRGIRGRDIPMLAKYAAKEANPLYPVPKLMTAKQLEKFYWMIKEAHK